MAQYVVLSRLSGSRSGKRPGTRTGVRLYGVDAARAVAIIGMIMVHFGPFPVPDTFFGSLYGITEGRASVLFVLLAGVGVTLASGGGSARPKRDAGWEDTRTLRSPGRARGRLVSRAALLLPLGLWLQRLDHGALVILQYYALYFLLAVAVLGVADRYLLRAAAAVLVFGPMIYLLARLAAPAWFAGPPATLGDPVVKIAHSLLLSGAYPLVTWAAPLLFGIWLGRRALSSAVVRRRLVIGGAAVAAGSALISGGISALILSDLPAGGPGGPGTGILVFLFGDEPHSQSPLWMVGSIGSACLVLGTALIAADLLPRLTWPLVATGQLALTVYVGHLVLLDLTGGLLDRQEVASASIAGAAFMAAAAVCCVAWRAVFSRGPLEAVLAAPWRAIEWLLGSAIRSRTRAEDASYKKRSLKPELIITLAFVHGRLRCPWTYSRTGSGCTPAPRGGPHPRYGYFVAGQK